MARAKSTYILLIKVNKLFPLKDIENMVSLFLLSFSVNQLAFFTSNAFLWLATLLTIYLTNRSQKMSKCGKNYNDAHGYRLVCHFFVLTTIWHYLWSITGQMYGNMEPICFI